MRTRHLWVLVGLIVVVIGAASCSSGSATHTVTTTVTKKASPTSGVATDTGRGLTTDTGSANSDTGAPRGAYCAAARTYDSDLAHFSADDSAQLARAVKDVSDLRSKAPKKLQSAYSAWLRILKQVQTDGTEALTSADTNSYRAAVNNITQYDHTHCGLPTYS